MAKTQREGESLLGGLIRESKEDARSNPKRTDLLADLYRADEQDDRDRKGGKR